MMGTMLGMPELEDFNWNFAQALFETEARMITGVSEDRGEGTEMTKTILGMPVIMNDALPDSIPFVLTLGHFNDYQMRMKATMKPEATVKARFRELLEEHPEMTRPQAYMQAVMEAGEPVIAAAVEGMEAETNDDCD